MMTTFAAKRSVKDVQTKASILVEALPYIEQFSGKRILVKVGGELIEDLESAKSLCSDLIFLKSAGIEVVLCHGGGPQISKTMKRFGLEPKFVNGLRVTDAETLELVMMVLLGNLNQTLVSLLNTHGDQAVGLSGIDGRTILVSCKNPELGFVGDVQSISTTAIEQLLSAGLMPVIASIGMDQNGQAYNVNADIVAAEIAKAIRAEKLILLTNVEGIYESFEDKSSLISSIDVTELSALFNSGALSAGMIPKVEAVLTALQGGVHGAHILDGRVQHSVLLEIFTTEGVGTMVTHNRGAQL